ncbi:RNA-directed DNA polymerase [Citrobacter portucalensis]|uniref:RNA-directed DNA polymerase n=1 Tax=Citrobacter portucalensis TaxID=1639133 RepID=UPI001F436B1E|nr:RNA-directed DNA polymerase [Citrobacter portucalensis]
MANEISQQCYQPSAYSRFAITDPKLREIYAPAFRDRLAQSWLVYHLNPSVERILIDDTFANRKGKGTLAAVKRTQCFMRQPGHTHYMQLDIQNFFNSIPLTGLLAQCKALTRRYFVNHPLYEILNFMLETCILHPVAQNTWTLSGDQQLLAAVPVHKTLAGAGYGRGLPLGSTASQMFANLWLSSLDHFIKHTLKVRGYVRYMDDLVLLGSSTMQLSYWRNEIQQFCLNELGLFLHPTKQTLQRCQQGADYLGYRVYPHHLHLRNRNIRRLIAWLHFFDDGLCGAKILHPPTVINILKWSCFTTGNPVTPDYPLLQRMQAVINSYLGMMLHTRHWRLRRLLWHKHAGTLKNWFIPSGSHYGSVRIKKRCLQDWIAQQCGK